MAVARLAAVVLIPWEPPYAKGAALKKKKKKKREGEEHSRKKQGLHKGPEAIKGMALSST